MNLKEFITQTLTEIAEGIRDANEPVQQAGGRAVPAVDFVAFDDDRPQSPIQLVDFDVAVTAQEESATKVGGGLLIAGIGLGGKTETQAQASSVSRIRFRVPMMLPPSYNQ